MQADTVCAKQGYQEAIFGSMGGAIMGVLAARFLAALLLGLGGVLGLEPRSFQEVLLLLLPPLGAAAVAGVSLRLSKFSGAFATALFLLFLSPLASWGFMEVHLLLGSAELWPLRLVPVALLTLLAPLSHMLARAFAPHGAAQPLHSASPRRQAWQAGGSASREAGSFSSTRYPAPPHSSKRT